MGAGDRTWTTLVCLWSAILLGLVVGCASDAKLTKAKGLYQTGVAAMGTDQQQAFVSFQKAVRLDPEHKEAHYYLGHLYFLRGKYDQAEEQFTKVLRIDPAYSNAHNYLGLVLERQGRWQAAIEAYRKALDNPLYLTPDKAWFNLGRALGHEGRFQEALDAFQEALLINPANLPPELIYLEMGKAYYNLDRKERAVEVLTRVLEGPNDGLTEQARRMLDQMGPCAGLTACQ